MIYSNDEITSFILQAKSKDDEDLRDIDIDNFIDMMCNLNATDFNINSSMSIAVVGNSGTILDNEYGSMIDDHDYVMRFNLGRVEGFEKSVGSKTDFRVIAAKSFYYGALAGYEGFDHDYLPSRFGERFFIRPAYGNESAVIGPCCKNYSHGKINLHLLSNNFVSYWDHKYSSTLSVGILGIIMATKLFKHVSLFGFDSWQSGQDKTHYFEKVTHDTTKNSHNNNNEKRIIEQLISENKVIRHA
jgi:hypothetical protein